MTRGIRSIANLESRICVYGVGVDLEGVGGG